MLWKMFYQMDSASPSIKKVKISYCMVDNDRVCSIWCNGVKLEEYMSR